MTEMKIRVESGHWDLKAILGYVKRLQDMKCNYGLNCDQKIHAINKEEGTLICKNHYSSLISGQSELAEKYEKVNSIIREIEDTFIDFQDTFINAKATISIFRSNKVALQNYKDLLEEINKVEKHLDFQITKTVKYASESMKGEIYNTYKGMKREMDLTLPDIEKIHELCMKVIYRLFNDNLIHTLNQACSKEKEEFKYDPYLTPIHPIFDRKITLFTMVCQTENSINSINDEITEKYNKIENAKKEFERFEKLSKSLYDKAERYEQILKNFDEAKNKIDSLNEYIKVLGDKNKTKQLNIQLTNENQNLKIEVEHLSMELKDRENKILKYMDSLSVIKEKTNNIIDKIKIIIKKDKNASDEGQSIMNIDATNKERKDLNLLTKEETKVENCEYFDDEEKQIVNSKPENYNTDVQYMKYVEIFEYLKRIRGKLKF